jgi:hypothetical protein
MSESVVRQWQISSNQDFDYYDDPPLMKYSGFKNPSSDIKRVSNREPQLSLDNVDFEALLENALLKVVQTRLK